MEKLFLILSICLFSLSLLSQSCLPEGIEFTTQELIDNFQTENPNCTEIEGDVEINGVDIVNLNGLNVITSITSFLGLDNITSVEAGVWIEYNNALNSVDSLKSLNSIGGSLVFKYNEVLNDLSGLENLISVGGFILIEDNDSLTNIEGLSNLDPNLINEFIIRFNGSLSNCAILSICTFLIDLNGNIGIYLNAPGCDSQEEVEEACETVSIDEVKLAENITTSPNPFTTSTTIEYELKKPEKVTITIYDYLGKQVYQTKENQTQGKQQLIWNTERYADGVYYYRLQAGDAVANGKMVKVR